MAACTDSPRSDATLQTYEWRCGAHRVLRTAMPSDVWNAGLTVFGVNVSRPGPMGFALRGDKNSTPLQCLTLPHGSADH